MLFPGTPLPLHIFEDRYKEMIGEAIENHTEFGVVLAGEKGILNTGCTAVVDKVVERYDDGRMDIIAVGRRRFEIMMLNDEKSYLRGAVEFFDDEEEEPGTPETRQRAMDGYKSLRDIEGGSELLEPEPGTPQLSFQLAQVIPDLNFRQTLLNMRSENERIARLADFLPSYIVRRREVAHVKHVAPHNGHGRWPAGL